MYYFLFLLVTQSSFLIIKSTLKSAGEILKIWWSNGILYVIAYKFVYKYVHVLCKRFLEHFGTSLFPEISVRSLGSSIELIGENILMNPFIGNIPPPRSHDLLLSTSFSPTTTSTLISMLITYISCLFNTILTAK